MIKYLLKPNYKMNETIFEYKKQYQKYRSFFGKHCDNER